MQYRNLIIHFFLTSISILPLYKKKIQFIWSVFQQWNQRNPSFKCYQLNLMTCILTQRHMWSPLSIIALPGGDSRDLFSRHWHNIDMYLTPNIGVICREIFTKCPWLQTLSFFVCVSANAHLCVYSAVVPKMDYEAQIRRKTFNLSPCHKDSANASCTAFLYTHNWKALSLYIYCIKPSCPYLKKKKRRNTGNLPSH